MRVIDIHPPVKVQIPMREGPHEKEVTFVSFLTECCNGYKPFTQGMEQGRIYDKIMDVLEAVNGGTSFTIEDKYFDPLKEAVKTATWLTPAINRVYLKGKFYDAVENAQEVKTPVEKK